MDNYVIKYRDNLPAQLNKSEIYDLIDKMYNGDKLARDKLISGNIRLVIHIVMNKFSTVNYDKEDLISIGTIGLIKGVETFDVSKNIEFSTYVGRCAEREILMFLRKLVKEQKYKVNSLEEVIFVDEDGKEFKLKDIIHSDIDLEQVYIDNELYRTVKRMVIDLPERDREIVMMSYGFYDDVIYTQHQISEKVNMAQPHVCSKLSKIIVKLRNQLEEQDSVKVFVKKNKK